MKPYVRYTVAIEGLKSANKGNPFWSRSDAMSLLNITRNNIRAYSQARVLKTQEG